MSIAMRILAFMAALLVLPLFVAWALAVLVIDVVRTTLIESVGLPEAPITIMVNVLNVGLLIGAFALAIIFTLRLRRWLAARFSLFHLEGEHPTEPEGPSRDATANPSRFMARVRRLDARLASKPPKATSRRRGRR